MKSAWWLLPWILCESLAALALEAHAREPVAAGRGDVTVSLVHGAFADSSSWGRGIGRLLKRHCKVIAASGPLRGLAPDAASVVDLMKSIAGDIVPVGHSFGGLVITAAAAGNPRVKSLVYVDALAPDTGESASDLGERFPGSTLGPTLVPAVGVSDGGKDLYILQDRLPAQFAADVPLAKARLMAGEQRPVTEAALEDELQRTPAWKSTPSWFIDGSLDKNITADAQASMARRAHSRHTVVIEGGSHGVMSAQPDAVAKLIAEAISAEKP